MPLLLLDILRGRKVWEAKEGEEVERERVDSPVRVEVEMDRQGNEPMIRGR